VKTQFKKSALTSLAWTQTQGHASNEQVVNQDRYITDRYVNACWVRTAGPVDVGLCQTHYDSITIAGDELGVDHDAYVTDRWFVAANAVGITDTTQATTRQSEHEL
jgi:hypothetical protein